MEQAPRIILKTDAHVTDEMRAKLAPVLRAFGEQLRAYAPPVKVASKVI
jgi:hypothetical protein